MTPHSRRLGRAALVLVASAFAATSLEAQRAHREDLPAPEVARLDIAGTSGVIEQDEIKRNVYTTATSCKSIVLFLFCKFGNWRAVEARHYLSHQELQRDVLRIRVLYYKHGYRETEVDTAVSRLNEKQVAVRFDWAGGSVYWLADAQADRLEERAAGASGTRVQTVWPGRLLDRLAWARQHGGDPAAPGLLPAERHNLYH